MEGLTGVITIRSTWVVSNTLYHDKPTWTGVKDMVSDALGPLVPINRQAFAPRACMWLLHWYGSIT